VRAVDFPPYTILRENEPPEGITIEYVKEMSRRTGIRIVDGFPEIVLVSFGYLGQ
jgi:hypothetical protein